MQKTEGGMSGKWMPLSAIPPDERLEVIDAAGNKGFANPCWYPFKMVPGFDKHGRRAQVVEHCEMYWDGSWLVECVGLESPVQSVVAWRPISDEE